MYDKQLYYNCIGSTIGYKMSLGEECILCT